jgi:8-oxo-dGTP pyrophosphatase MutT (NUDIX family)
MDNSVLRIGFSGHQQLGDETTQQFVAQQLRELLIKYQQWAHEHRQKMLVYSALAMGADQLFVKTALELSIPVEVVIPCARYEEIFSTEEARSEYRRLLEAAQQIHRLPSHECSDEAYLAAGQWIVDHSDLLIVVWNGYPAAGKGGTAEFVHYARSLGLPFVHVSTRKHPTKQYGAFPQNSTRVDHVTARREFAVSKQTVYQGPVLRVDKYHMCLPNGKQIERDIVERPESVLVLPVGQNGTVLLIEEYDLGAEAWQLTLPGGKVTDLTPDGIRQQAEIELREEIGYRPGRLEKLLDFYSHPGYMAHKVHLFVAFDLEWEPLEMDEEEEIRVRTFTLEEALAATREDYRCDPEAALALWLYVGSTFK